MDYLQKLANSLGEHLVGSTVKLGGSHGEHHHTTKGNNRNHCFQEHRAITDDDRIGFDAKLLRGCSRRDQRMKTRTRTAGNGDE